MCSVRESCASDGEDEGSSDALVEEMLQQGDTAVIYPEAPDDHLGTRQHTPDASGQDENGTPDAFSQLLTCPYCSRGYKRYTSLKEHIKYRHEKSEDNFSCSHCSYTFAYRTQLERHMAAHKLARDQKPYECSNCKKRFSHSGSYSSHISSKKCISVVAVNGRPRSTSSKTQSHEAPASPTPGPRSNQVRDKPLQEQLPLNQIKSEPVDYEYKPATMAASLAGPGVNGGLLNGGMFNGGAAGPLQGAVQAVVLPTVGLVSPISINLADLQNMFKVAVDGNVIRQVLENNAKVAAANGELRGAAMQHLPHTQQLISAISLPIVGQDGNAKIIINYSLDPSQTQLQPQNLKKEPISPARGSLDICKSQKLPEDLTVRSPVSKDKEALEAEEEEKTTKRCLLCDHCPAGMEELHALKHCKKDGLRLNRTGLDKSESAIVALMADGALCCEPKNLLSLLKAYFALNAEPTNEDLAKISDSVNLPAHVVKKLFDKMQEGQLSLGALTPPAEKEDSCESKGVVSLVPGRDMGALSPSATQGSPTEATPAEVNGLHSSPPASPPSPLNLTAGGPVPPRPPHSTEGPLDLSLPKASRDHTERVVGSSSPPSAGRANGEEPLNLTCIKKEPCTPQVSHPSANPFSIMTTQLPAEVAITEQGRMPCLRAITTTTANSNKQTILIPQLAYTYATAASSPAGTETVHLNGIKEEEESGALEEMERAGGEMEAMGMIMETLERPSPLASQLDSDERGSSTRDDEESEEEEEEREEEEARRGEEGEEGSMVDMDDIQVVQIGDEGGDEEDDDEEEEEEEGEVAVDREEFVEEHGGEKAEEEEEEEGGGVGGGGGRRIRRRGRGKGGR
ncbi:hypothetical protein CRUP_033707 [Coryphaenoides rupestris]|nr:hypothetical protein CRUP_033707 [Coryphaenoides rupestris]